MCILENNMYLSVNDYATLHPFKSSDISYYGRKGDMGFS